MGYRKMYRKQVKYGPLPDVDNLPQWPWKKTSEMPGVDFNEQAQLDLLAEFSKKYAGEYDNFPHNPTPAPHEFYMNNTAFGPVDAEILYCMVRNFKPRKIIEIGSGFSTRLSAKAILKNKEDDDSYECELTAIEPDPKPPLADGFPGLSRLLVSRVEDVPLSQFEQLGENDILFIDSSHVLKTGSDVHYEYLEIVPRVNKGVLVHCHDIFLPEEYMKEGIKGGSFWNEQYLLHAFLLFNDAFKIIWAGNYMHNRQPGALKEAFKSCRENDLAHPGSIWMKRMG